MYRLDEAEAAVRRSRETVTSDDFSAQAAWRAVQAKILARRGEHEEAERLAREAVENIDRSDELEPTRPTTASAWPRCCGWRAGPRRRSRSSRTPSNATSERKTRVSADTTRALLAELRG